MARALDEIARYIELGDPNRFKSRAYERAARAVENLQRDLGELVSSGDLYKTAGIGKAIGPVIEELVRTGSSRYLDELRQQYPPGIFDLLRVPGLGLKKIGMLYTKLGIGSLADLEEAARSGRLKSLRGFGTKTQEKMLSGVERARLRQSRYLLPVGLEVGELMRARLAAIDAVVDAEVTGSVRRRLEVIRNVNLAVATNDRETTREHLTRFVDQLEERDESTLKGVARNEIEVLFHLCAPEHFGETVLRSTGSAEFVEAVKELGSSRKIRARTEEEYLQKAGLPFVEPERRESASDLRRKRRPALVQPTDLKGTFHVHSTFSDGRHTIEQMLAASRERGFQYVGLSDHSKAAYYAGGLTEQRVADQHAEIDRHEPAMAPMRIFRGTEADILPDGSIDYGPKTLDLFDFVIASIHSQFQMDKEQMTERMLKALDDPHVTILGHLTGRKLLQRDGYQVDFDRVFERAAERGVVIEINGNPNRLDLDWRHIGRAAEMGVIFSINPDAHSMAELSHVISGTWVARKAGLTQKHILNARPVDEVEQFLAGRRSARHRKHQHQRA